MSFMNTEKLNKRVQQIKQAARDRNLWAKTQNHIKVRLDERCRAFILKYYKYFPIFKNKIVFDNFGGRGFGDHPRYIAEEMHKRHPKMDLVWLVRDLNEPMPGWIRKVQVNSIRALWEVSTAKAWVDNIRNAHLLQKRKQQVYLQTWHGCFVFAFKTVEKDAQDNLSKAYVRAAQYDGTIIDGIISQSLSDSEQYKRAFWLSEKAEILEFGGPREDFLFDELYVKKRKKQIREEMDIKEDDYVILYAPTFRDSNDTTAYSLDFEQILEAFQMRTKKNCKLVIRLHPNVSQSVRIISENATDVSKLSDANDAIILCDAIISDFSGILYESCILRKTPFRCAVDYDSFIKQRHLNKKSEEYPFLLSKSSNELIEQIMSIDFQEYWETIDNYIARHRSYDDGHASEKTVNWLISKMNLGHLCTKHCALCLRKR